MAVLISTNPAKGYQTIGEVTVSTLDDVQTAVANARKAQPAWAALSVSQRSEYFTKLASVIDARADEIAQCVTNEMGKPSTDAKNEVADIVDSIRWMVDNAPNVLANKTLREDNTSIVEQIIEPYGVCAAIAAWNFPVTNFKECALQDLLAGNTVVFKHSEENPLTGKLIDELVAQAGFPNGVFTQVYGSGDVGSMLVEQDIDFISFIGSSKVGRELYKKAAEKFINVRLEMGGSSPGIVFDDVDIPATAELVIGARFFNSGQVCDALKRLLVHESIFEDFVAELQKQISAIKFGDPTDSSTTVSSLVAERQVQPILDQINQSVDAGAIVLCGGKAADLDGAYIEPTLLVNVKPDMPVWSQEVFGPVLPVMKFSTEDQAVALANDTEYGLSGYVYSADKDRALRVAKAIKAGQVATNGVHNYYPNVCFGGYKASGIGRTCGPEGLLAATQIKIVTRLK